MEHRVGCGQKVRFLPIPQSSQATKVAQELPSNQ
nr:MAG TPA: hypothetical protein [Caudoviricetes sp.]